MINNPDSGRGTRRGRTIAALVAAAVITLGVTSCAQQIAPAGPSNNSGQSASPTTRRPPSTSPTVSGKSGSAIRPHGNIRQHAKTHKISYRKHVPLTGSARFSNGVVVSVIRVRSVTAHPIGPGEIGGPALALNVKIKNGSSSALDLSTVTVNLNTSKGTPAVMTTGSPAAPLTGSLASGDSSTGTYVFTVAEVDRKPITVQVQYGNGQTVLQFSGNAA